MKRHVFLLLCAFWLTGCAALPANIFGDRNRPEPEQPASPVESEAVVPGNARTVEEFDTTSSEDRIDAIEAARPTSGETDLGVTVASLGDVTQPGIWLKTPLVAQAGPGRVEFPEKGTAVALDLLPLAGDAGAGSRISLAAMRLLEADLTSLPELRVYRKN